MNAGVLYYLEVFSAVLALLCVWLAAINKVWNWPIAMASSMGYIFVFFYSQLYSDAVLNIVFLGFQTWGWWSWRHHKESTPSHLKKYQCLVWLFLIVILYLPWVIFITDVLPQLPIFLFGDTLAILPPPRFPYLDAALMMLSILALIMQSKRWLQHWYIWIVVDLFYVPMYYLSDNTITAALYAVYIVLAVYGLRKWQTLMKIESNPTD